jgi:hypothetical protein
MATMALVILQILSLQEIINEENYATLRMLHSKRDIVIAINF